MTYTLEVCVDSVASALAAKRGGADRLELCADLIIGGTTPSLALVRQVKAETGLPVRALLRPRFGDFCYDRYELAQMAETAAALVQAGADHCDRCADPGGGAGRGRTAPHLRGRPGRCKGRWLSGRLHPAPCL